jgi:hypothetical protein
MKISGIRGEYLVVTKAAVCFLGVFSAEWWLIMPRLERRFVGYY